MTIVYNLIWLTPLCHGNIIVHLLSRNNQKHIIEAHYYIE